MIEWKLPIKTVSENNCSEHWHKKSKRHTVQQAYVKIKFNNEIVKPTLPCSVEIVRIAARKLDSDNLQGSMKWIRDQIADCLIPGKAKGFADSDERINWLYSQEKGKPKEYAIIIRFY